VWSICCVLLLVFFGPSFGKFDPTSVGPTFPKYSCSGQWRSKGGRSKWEHVPWSAGLGDVPSNFCSHFKTHFKQKLNQSIRGMLKKAYFLEKTVKMCLSVGDSRTPVCLRERPRFYSHLLLRLLQVYFWR